MARLILRISVSIDGFLEASAGKLDFAKSRSPEGAALVAERMAQAGAHLLGRKAFCEMASFWPAASGPNAKAMNEIPKIVFSRKGLDPAQATGAKGWADAQVATGDLAEAIAKLKERSGKDLMAHGGIEFAREVLDFQVFSLEQRLEIVALSIGVSWLSYRFVERPFIRGKHWPLKYVYLFGFLSLLGLAAFGLAISHGVL